MYLDQNTSQTSKRYFSTPKIREVGIDIWYKNFFIENQDPEKFSPSGGHPATRWEKVKMCGFY